MLRGTRVISGEEANLYRTVLERFRFALKQRGFQEVILPSIWEQQTFIEKAGDSILKQMYSFTDKGDRPICLIPEATAIIEELYKKEWEKTLKKPVKIFYEQRCYRYERPQSGRYREFTQFGVEVLGGKSPRDNEIVKDALSVLLSEFNFRWEYVDAVKRGLAYYVEDGFEVECPSLGAQKQILGGGRYSTGIGFAIGIDRLLLAIQNG